MKDPRFTIPAVFISLSVWCMHILSRKAVAFKHAWPTEKEIPNNNTGIMMKSVKLIVKEIAPVLFRKR